MTDLTEKWKAGELEEGWYYIKYEGNEVGIAFACEWIGRYEYPCVGFEFEDDIEEVLAPVPSFKELQSLKAQLAEHKEYCCCAKNEVLVLENARLKELMKECHNQLSKLLVDGVEPQDGEIIKFLTKIEEVLK